MSFLEIFYAFEADQIDVEEALVLSGCFDLIDLFEMAAAFNEMGAQKASSVEERSVVAA